MHTSEASSRSEGSKTIARPYCLLARMFKFASLCNDYQQGVLQNNDENLLNTSKSTSALLKESTDNHVSFLGCAK